MGLFSKLAKAAIHAVTTPVAVVKDVATMGGLCTGEPESYTSKQIKKLGRDVEEIESEVDDL